MPEGDIVVSVRPVVFYKLRAALISFSVFLLFAALLAFFTYRFWYPDYLFFLDGGIQGLKLVYAVDFVLGPLLALVFFHPEKSRKKLVFDICVIALVQVSAMTWGAYQVCSQRPVVVVYGSGRFISVAPELLALQRKSAPDMRAFSDTYPPYAFRRETQSALEKQKKLTLLMGYGIHFEGQVWLFEPYKTNLDKIFEKQSGTQSFIRDVLSEEWNEWAAKHQDASMSDYRYAFYEGRYENAVLIFSPDGQYRGYLEMATFLPAIEDTPPVSQ